MPKLTAWGASVHEQQATVPMGLTPTTTTRTKEEPCQKEKPCPGQSMARRSSTVGSRHPSPGREGTRGFPKMFVREKRWNFPRRIHQPVPRDKLKNSGWESEGPKKATTRATTLFTRYEYVIYVTLMCDEHLPRFTPPLSL